MSISKKNPNKSKNTKGRSTRKKDKYPHLTKKNNIKRRQELIDFDYIHKLSDTEKKFLNDFMGEFAGASFKKTSNGSHHPQNIHRRSKTKEIYDANNARNRDIFSTKNCIGGIQSLTEVELDDLREKDQYTESNDFEDAMIDYLDSKDPED